jgi:RNA polymerase sigma-70 factor (ECF subfamily)
MRHELIQLLHAAIARLPDDYREAIRLQFLESLPVVEVARRMNRTEHAVHMLVSRAKSMLREILGRSSKFFGSG